MNISGSLYIQQVPLVLISYNGLYNSCLALTLHFKYFGRGVIEIHYFHLQWLFN